MEYNFLIKAFPKSKVATLIPFLGDAFLYAGVTTPDRVRMFLAQAAHECQGFRVFRENLNYSAQGLANTWPTRYAVNANSKIKTPNEVAKVIAHKPEIIANLTYANRNGNGSVESGDGWLFRGGGCPMLTGRANYRLVDQLLKPRVSLELYPGLIVQPYYAVMSFAVFWKDNNLNRFADKQDVRGARRAINGGLIGLADVTKNYNNLKKYV